MSADVSTTPPSDDSSVPVHDRESVITGSAIYAFLLFAACSVLLVVSAFAGYIHAWGWWLAAALAIAATLMGASEFSAIRLPFRWGSATISVGAICGLGV